MPDYIRRTYDRLGIPEAEKKFLAGVGGAVRLRGRLPQHPRRPREAGRHLRGTPTRPCASTPRSSRSTSARSSRRRQQVRRAEHRGLVAAARSSTSRRASMSSMPLQAYFRINTENMGQFERTLIIADEGRSVHYVEGCTAPTYTTRQPALRRGRDHRQEGRARAATRRSRTGANNVYNLVTKRAVAYEDAVMEWVDGNLGSQLTMKYPVRLPARRACSRRGAVASPSPAAASTRTPAARSIHAAPNTTSLITSKSISQGTGRTSVSRPDQGLPRLPWLEVDRSLRRPDPLRRGAAPTRTPTWRSTRTTSPSATRRRSRRSARSSSST